MKVYIVRHGKVPHNVLKMYGAQDDDLTELGVQQAEELKERIKYLSFDKVISSPLLRATHTEYILTNYDDSIIIDERLRERSCGNLSGVPLELIDREAY